MSGQQLTFDFFDDLPDSPDMEQIARITLANWKKHLKAVGVLEGQISKLIDNAVKEAARLGNKISPADIGRAFRQNPTLRNALDSIMQQLAEDITTRIEQGSKEAWLRSNTTGNATILQMAAGNAALATLLQSQQTKPQNDRALIAFQKREVAGMNLSQRVWNIVESTQRDMERAIEVALAEGTPAAKLSLRVRQLLQEPNRLYRRVRDKNGNLRLSQAARQYKPGRGVYRSSYKNAMRLARTEVNMAYHTADNERWQNSWWVRGIRIWLSNNHTVKDSKGHPQPLVDICDELKGDYPADFKFTGWHPQCRCIATALTCSYADIRDYYRRKRAGEDMTGYTPPGTIKDPPAAFKNWLSANADRLAGAAQRGTTPYFIANNAKYTDPSQKSAITPPAAPPSQQRTTLQIAAERHAHRTATDVQDIQFRWSRRRANRIDLSRMPASDTDRYNKLIQMTTWGNKDKFNIAEFNAMITPILRHTARTDEQSRNIRLKWGASRIEQAGETAKVAKVRKAIDKQQITDIADVQRIMRVFYDQFPEEFNNVRINFVRFDEPRKGGSFTLGYSKHNIEIAFNANNGGFKESPLETLIKSFEKIRVGKKLNLAQLRSIDTVVHELLHQKAGMYTPLRAHGAGDYKRTAMETMNEFAARTTAAKFLRRLGADTQGVEMLIRQGDGYQAWEKRLLTFIDKAGLSPLSVGAQFATALTTKPYDAMDAELYAFLKAHANKKGFTQSMDEVLEALESGKKWSSYINKWFP